MIISTKNTISIRCFKCGKINFAALSRFCIKRGTDFRVACECGADLALISRNKDGVYLQLKCAMCETQHQLKYQSAQLWKAKLIRLTCANTGLETGYIGNTREVKEAVLNSENTMREIADQFGSEGYFLNPEIMNQVLDLLQKGSEEGRVSCNCGSSDLEAEVYPDRVEINCIHCGAVGIVFAETVRDLQCASKMEEIELEAYTHRYLDGIRLKKRGSSRNRNN